MSADSEVHWFRVTDEGPPVTDAERRQLLAPLGADMDLRSQAGVGSGLGLYLVRNLAAAIDGDVTFLGTNTLALALPWTLSGFRRSRGESSA